MRATATAVGYTNTNAFQAGAITFVDLTAVARAEAAGDRRMSLRLRLNTALANLSLGARSFIAYSCIRVEEVARVIARECRAVGMGHACEPMLAVFRDARWGRVAESYGEDPLLVSRLAVAYVNGAQERGYGRFEKDKIIAMPKHFVADGEPWAGVIGEGFETSQPTLREIHMPPFQAAVKLARRRCDHAVTPRHRLHGHGSGLRADLPKEAMKTKTISLAVALAAGVASALPIHAATSPARWPARPARG